MDTNVHVVPTSKTKALLLLILAVGFVSLGVWFLSLDPETIEARDRYNNPTFIYGLGWVTIVFFGTAALASCWRLMSAKPGLKLDKEGVTIFLMSKDMFVPWQDVSGLSAFEIQRNKMLVLNLKDPQKYIENRGALGRSVARANYRLCGSPIAISSSAVKLNFLELQELIESYVRRYASGT